MSRSAWSLLRSLTRRLPADREPLADADLLRRFADDRDQAAFEVLVWRHGGMVLGVCRRLLRDEHAAEDAYQATFLILARKAGSVRGNVAGWLHRVARRVAIRASKRAKPERLAADPPSRPTTSSDPELAALLDTEIDRLPDRFRLPVVLCYLDGRRTEDAAKLLGVPRGTVLSRLATARQTLAARLTRRGVTLPAGGLAATVTAEQVTASVSAASRFVAGGLTGGTVQLANEVLHMGVRKQVIGWAVVLVATAGVGTGAGVVANNQPVPGKAADPPPVAVAQKPAQPAEKPKPAEPTDAERAAKERAVRMDRLQHAVMELTKQAHTLERSIVQQTTAGADQVDITALQAAITRLDGQILDAEEKLADTKQFLEDLKRMPADGSGEPPPVESQRDYGPLGVLRNPAVKQAGDEVSRLAKYIREIPKAAKDPAPLLAKAQKDLEQAQAKYAEVRDQEFVKQWRAQRAASLRAGLEEWPRRVAAASADLNRLMTRRAQLAGRLARHIDTSEKVRQLEDELRVIRELRAAVLRADLQTRLDISLPPTPTAESPDLSNRLSNLTRQLTDLRSALLTTDGKNRLDVFQQQLDALQNEVRQIGHQRK